jgi:hypothetical protein
MADDGNRGRRNRPYLESVNMQETRLSTALRAANQSETQEFLTHRSAIRKTLIRVLADIDSSNWTMRDDEILDLCEAWLKERLLRRGMPKTPNFGVAIARDLGVSSEPEGA